jgi:KDO2-lipid IV(A) lauroyltransferase
MAWRKPRAHQAQAATLPDATPAPGAPAVVGADGAAPGDETRMALGSTPGGAAATSPAAADGLLVGSITERPPAGLHKPEGAEEKAYQERAKTRGYGLPSWLPMVRVLKIGARIPNWAWRPLAKQAAKLAVRRQYKAVRQWALNAEVMLGRPVTRDEMVAAMESWFENLAGSMQLGKYSPEQNFRRVVIDDADMARLATSWRGPGAVVALPHMGDWDLGGAFICAKGIPVASVAERLPDQEFEYFMAIRQKVGMTIYSHKDSQSLHKLEHDVHAGKVIALVADRDLSRHSVPVTWHTPSGDQAVTMPPGPALIAQASGADLLVAVCTYEGPKMRIRFFGPVAVSPGEDGLVETEPGMGSFVVDPMPPPAD